MKDKQGMLDCLKEIVAEEPWDESRLAEWANEFLFYVDCESNEQCYEAESRHTQLQITSLRPQVEPYQYDPALPVLPTAPDGQLHGIGFIYDEDRDDRVLVAIDNLKDENGIVALAEHEGRVKIYLRLPRRMHSISVGGDEWIVVEYVPYQGRWTEATNEFINNCVSQVIGQRCQSGYGEQATAKQLSYLMMLGYDGEEPKTKGAAGRLIAEYKSKKGAA